mmetsp:Transcript_37219/g.81042  ORF Transcript_37219/g.81042 Transcript_37219/m.81042 type:complete len:561 (-) Transcript_37219:149-1831(-)|eukprot:CAMPEP_0118941890 /NCGR_PEP_ID=MMETSP1169-20130426/34907_1 /TAXON_ID=36882 /ORGANISM="Pyramimonas obovata, Strain CCMP722" /LENGTH=560 /DNA_ID=CAMNT_0006886773 /DNA_START=15 /DNA_END=1697 /DNA_ORIENTATION=+
MSVQKFEFPIVFQDLPQHQTYAQLCDSLERLDNASKEIFSRINSRINEQRGKLGDITARVQTCEAQIAAIASERRKATTVLSSNKYPAGPVLPNFESFYSPDEASEVETVCKSLMQRADERANSVGQEEGRRGGVVTTEDETLELFRFFADADQMSSYHEEEKLKEGLGKLPANLASVANLLLFNSTENPYKKYQSLDNLAGHVEVTTDEQPTAVETLAEAPHTVIESTDSPMLTAERYGFKPKLGQVPTFNLPAFLPNLPMVADDLTWSGDTRAEPVLAPSLLLNALPDVPDVQIASTDGATPPEAKAGPSGLVSSHSDCAVEPNTPAGPPPVPPPPPPELEKPLPPPPPLDPPLVDPPPTVAPPQPPAPPTQPHADSPPAALESTTREVAPPSPPPTEEVALPSPPPVPSPSSSADAGRNALLDEIRNPNVKLRKVTDPPPTRKNQTTEDAVKPPSPALNPRDALLDSIKEGVKLKPREEQTERAPTVEKLDMLSELAKSLNNRRSGMQKDSEKSNTSFPPPPPKPPPEEDFARSKITGLRQYLEEHEDDDDDGDWDD